LTNLVAVCLAAIYSCYEDKKMYGCLLSVFSYLFFVLFVFCIYILYSVAL